VIDFKQHITRLEEKFARRSSASTAIAWALRCWQACKFFGGDEYRAALRRAGHALVATQRRNAAHAPLYLLTVFVSIELGNYDTAREMLDVAMSHKSFMRSSRPLYYGGLRFLCAHLDIRQDRMRSAKKHWRALAKHVKTAAPSPHYFTMLGLLHLSRQEYADAYDFLSRAFVAGGRSVFLYEGLCRYYNEAPRSPENGNVLPVLAYAAARGMDVSHIADKYQVSLSPLPQNPTGWQSQPVEIDTEEFLRENLLRFRVQLAKKSRVRYIYVSEPEKRGMAVYDATDDLIIEATGDDATFICLGAGRREVVDEMLSLTRVAPAADAELYLRFFQEGDRRFHLLAYLANYFIGADDPPQVAVEIFEAVLAEKSITKQYRNRVLAALGRIHYMAGRFDPALECYDAVGDALCSEALFEKLAILREKSANPASLAADAYRVLLGGIYDENLLALVLEHYDASYAELIALSRVLEAGQLDAIILRRALWMATWDADCQKAFVRNTDDELATSFVEYAIYEMLSNQERPEYDALAILERCYLEKEPENIFLAWGLASVYLSHNIATFNSEKIIGMALAALENEGILFPMFKENASTSFIQKHQPFMYRALPGKDCVLHYSVDGGAEYTAAPMRYVKFGIYAVCIPVFYNDEVRYYFSEDGATTAEAVIKNIVPYICDDSDSFFAINNAIIYQQMFKYDQVEEIAAGLVKEVQAVRSKIL